MIGIICAMESELHAIVRRMDGVSQRHVAKIDFYIGYLHGTELVLALAGVGKVSAAIASTLLLQLYHPKALINIGVAGGLLEDQQVGDLVISDTVVQADFDTSPVDGDAGIGLTFQADEQLAQLFLQAALDLNARARLGMVATQDLFMARDEDVARLKSLFPQSACSEMEGAACAQAAKAFGTPFVILRSLSDVAVHDDNHMEFDAFARESSERAADLLEACVVRL